MERTKAILETKLESIDFGRKEPLGLLGIKQRHADQATQRVR
jgi:hypothetical protein